MTKPAAHLTVGTKIFNRGDMANLPHVGRIVALIETDWGHHVTIETDEMDRYTVPSIMVHDKDIGNGLTRIVTMEAHLTWKREQIAKLAASIGR